MADVSLAIVGATGLVGRQLLAALEQREVDPSTVRLYASEKSEGESVDLGGESLEVEKLSGAAWRESKVAILAVPPELARPIALEAQAAGVWVVDCSGGFRADPKVPLVVPGLNDEVLDTPFDGRVVTLASAASQALLLALEPLKHKFGLAFADATVLYGAASAGKAGADLLAKQTAQLLNAQEPTVEVFPHRLGFNVIPLVGEVEGGLSRAERTVLVEAARVWSGAELPAVTATALWVPTLHGLTLVISTHLKHKVDADGVRAALKEGDCLKVIDAPAEGVVPMPMLVTDDSNVHVGRIRTQGEHVQLVATVDNTQRLAEGALDVAFELGEGA